MKNGRRQEKSAKRIPLGKALLLILFSCLIVSGSSFFAVIYFRHLKEGRRHDLKYNIVALVQTSKDQECLKTGCLAELLDLSVDNPRNLYAFDAKRGRQNLKSSPVIKEAEITKIRPGTIWVDYALRKPIAFLGDYTNTAIDAEGVAFPFNPFFTPKSLPEFYLGIADEHSGDNPWGANLQGKRLALALLLLETACRLFPDPGINIISIDVSRAFCSSCGQRQVIVALHDRTEKVVKGVPKMSRCLRLLRLGTDNYRQQFENFVILHAYLRQNESRPTNTADDNSFAVETMVIDLRLSDMAFISTSSL